MQEAAAGLKALESSVAAYLAKMVPADDSRILHEKGVEQGTCLTYELMRELDSDVCTTILRVPIEGSEIDTLAARVSTAVISLRGPMGWIPEARKGISGRSSTSSLMRCSRPSTGGLASEASHLHHANDDSAKNGDGDSFSSLINGLDDRLRANLIESTDRLVETLIDLVLPTMAEAYINISRNSHEDPVQFMADFLHAKGVEKESQARESAHKAFLAALAEASARESKNDATPEVISD